MSQRRTCSCLAALTIDKSLETLPRVALGSDSPLTAAGDLLDEIRFAASTVCLSSEDVYSLVTTRAADVLRLNSGEGTLRIDALADFFAVRDTGESPAHRLAALKYRDVEFVVIGGRVQLTSPTCLLASALVTKPACALSTLKAKSAGFARRSVVFSPKRELIFPARSNWVEERCAMARPHDLITIEVPGRREHRAAPLTQLPVLVLHAHTSCNCRCVMCDIWKTNESRASSALRIWSPISTPSAGSESRWVVLSGGEPLLNANGRNSARSSQERIRLTFFTTGLLLGK